MKQHLLRFIIALFAISIWGGTSWGQNVIWSEDWSSATEGQKPEVVNSMYTSKDSKSITKIYNENRSGGTAPELLIAKNSGSWTIKDIDITGISGELTLSFKSNYGNYLVIKANETKIAENPKEINDNQYEVTFTVDASSNKLT